MKTTADLQPGDRIRRPDLASPGPFRTVAGVYLATLPSTWRIVLQPAKHQPSGFWCSPTDTWEVEPS